MKRFKKILFLGLAIALMVPSYASSIKAVDDPNQSVENSQETITNVEETKEKPTEESTDKEEENKEKEILPLKNVEEKKDQSDKQEIKDEVQADEGAELPIEELPSADIDDGIIIVEDQSDILLEELMLTYRDSVDSTQKNNARVRTGETTFATLTVGVGGNVTAKEESLAFRLTVPQGKSFRVNENSDYSSRFGTSSDPYGTPDPADQNQYVWFLINPSMAPGQARTITFTLQPFNVGIASGIPMDIKVDGFEKDGNRLLPIKKSVVGTALSYADVFSYQEVTNSLGNRVQNVTNKSAAVLSDYIFTQNASPLSASTTKGLVYTSKVVFKNTFEVPLDDQGVPLIKISRENIVKPDGSPFSNSEINVEVVGQYIKSFTVMNEVIATPGTQLTNAQGGFKLLASTFDAQQIQNQFNLATGASAKMSITNTNSEATAYPVGKVDGMEGTSLNLVVRPVPTFELNYTNANERGDESLNQTFSKRIVSIGNVGTLNSNMDKLGVYQNDIVTFDYASNWKNLQENEISSLIIGEYADAADGFGYKSSELAPIRIKTGSATRTKGSLDQTRMDVLVKYKDGTSQVLASLSGDDFKTSQTLNIPKDMQEEVASIEYKYTNVDSGFAINDTPKIDFRVIDQKDPTAQGRKMRNFAKLEMTYDGTTTQKESTEAYFRYRDAHADQTGMFGSLKNGTNLLKREFQQKDDVYQFTIEFENKTNDPLEFNTIYDEFTNNLSPYNGDRVQFGNPDAALMDAKYLAVDEAGQPTNDLNLKLWEADGLATNTPGDQSKIANIQIVEKSGKEMSTLVITLAGEGVTLLPGDKMQFTYTMYVNDRFVEDAAIGNTFDALDKDGEKIVSGFWWSTKPVEHVTHDKLTFNKKAINASGITRDERPYTNDIIIYTLEFENIQDTTWTNITVEDTYTNNIRPYTGFESIRQELIDEFGLKEGLPLNLSVSKDKDGNLVQPDGFDDTQLSVTLKPAGNGFKIDFGNNEFKPGEKLYLSYTMEVDENATAKQAIVNQFRAYSNGDLVVHGKHTWQTNDNARAKGVVSAIHTVEGREVDSVKPNTGGLTNGQELNYGVELSNYLPRTNRFINVKNVFVDMPNFVTYKDDTIVVKTRVSVKQDDGTYKLEVSEVSPNDYDVIYDATTNELQVLFKTEYSLPGGVQGSDLNKSTHSVLIEYVGVVDSTNVQFPPIPSDQYRKDVTSTAIAFYKEPREELVAKSGRLFEKTDTSEYNDNDPLTNSYVVSDNKVSVLNENNAFGWISKKVNSEDAVIDLKSTEKTSRRYTSSIMNVSFKQFTVSHVVDLLPDYETLDGASGIQVKTETGEYEAIYNLDTVTLDGKEYNRITVTGYIESGAPMPLVMPAVKTANSTNKIDILYKTNIDTQEAMESIFTKDKYTADFTNRVAMYSKDDMTLAKPTGMDVSTAVKKDDDHIAATDWDSNPETQVRFETSAQVKSVVPAIAPFLGVKAQIIEITQDGPVYRDVKDTDYIDPGDIIGWHVSIGNANMPYTPIIKKGSLFAVELPDGLTFEGYKDGSTPSFLEEVVVKADSNVLVWKTTQDIDANGLSNSFTFKAKTRVTTYDTYSVSSYFVPTDVEEYGFINSKIKASPQYKTYNFEPNTSILNEKFGLGDVESSYVYNSVSVNVLGNMQIGGRLEAKSQSDASIKASTNVSPYFMTLNNVDDVIEYTMLFDVNKPGVGVHDITFINRLGGDGDRYVIRNQDRNSQGKAVLVGNGSFSVTKANATTGAVIETLDPSNYQIQYAVVPYNYAFTPADWDRDTNTIWMSEADLLANGHTFEEVTATRTLISNDVKLDMNEGVKVNYLAHLEDYYMENWQVNNSYAYNARVSGNIPLQVETRAVGVKSKINTDRFRLITEVIDPALVPLQTKFDMDIVGFNKVTGEEELRVTKEITVNEIAGLLQNISMIEKLSRDLRYEVQPKLYEGFRAPTVSITSKTDNNGLTLWEAKVIYERIVYDQVDVQIEVNRVNDLFPIESINYQLEVVDSGDNPVNQIDKTVAITDNSGSDSITDIETGNNYKIELQDFEHYTKTIERIDQPDLDTTGKHVLYKVIYNQIPVDQIDVLVEVNQVNNLFPITATNYKVEASDTNGSVVETFDRNVVVSDNKGSDSIKDIEIGNTYELKAQEFEHYTVRIEKVSEVVLDTTGKHITYKIIYDQIPVDQVNVKVLVNQVNDLFPVNDVDYVLQASDTSGNVVDTYKRNVIMSNNNGSDSITDIEVGKTYELLPTVLEHYTVRVEQGEDVALDTGGKIVSYTIIYDQIPVDQIDVAVEVKPVNNLYPINEANYKVELLDQDGNIANTLDRNVTLNGNSGNDSIIDIETGYSYKIIPTEYLHYKVSVEKVSETTNAQGGKHVSYKIVYEQITVDEVNVDVVIQPIDGKYPVLTTDYTLNTISVDGNVSVLNRSVAIKDNSGNDKVENLETGNTYAILPKPIANYNVSVEKVSEIDLETGGKSVSFKIIYKQVDGDKPKPEKPDPNKPGPQTTDNNANTGVDNSIGLYLGLLGVAIIAVVVVIIVKRKRNDD